MSLKLNGGSWKRYFQVPCALVDSYLKLASGPALKLFLYLASCEDSPDEEKIISATGIKKSELEEAVMFWRELGVISGSESGAREEIAEKTSAETVTKVVHSRYSPKDMAEMIQNSPKLRELFDEAETTLGRILKHADRETLINLTDYYGFDEESVVLILGYCAELEKTSARYYETVAKSLFEKGIVGFKDIEAEFERMRERHSFESQIKRDFGIDVKLSQKQKNLISEWRDMGFGVDMISLARERCTDATNKISFAYIDKILKSWHEKNIGTVEAALSERKPTAAKTERSFDLDEFDRFTLGTEETT